MRIVFDSIKIIHFYLNNVTNEYKHHSCLINLTKKTQMKSIFNYIYYTKLCNRAHY